MTININGYSNSYNLFTGLVAPIKRAPMFCGNATNPIAPSDNFCTNRELSPYLSKDAINELLLLNPKINKILESKGIKPEINIKELQKLANGHLKTTKSVALAIIQNLPTDARNEINQKAILEAAIYHDFGKVLIPDKILNKKGALSDKEREVMQLHSELGYELLKTQNISRRTLELVKYHHQNNAGNGYPQPSGDFEYNIEAEILALADKYSALTEQRAYKPALTPYEALKIIKQENPPSPALEALEKFITTTSKEEESSKVKVL